MGGFASTPVFELFRRGLSTSTVKRFRGLNAYRSIADLGPEWAQSLLNVIVGADGALHKFRVPQVVSPAIPGIVSGPSTFFDFQQQNGTRQVLANMGTGALYFLTNNMTVPNLIENNLLNVGIWSFAEAQNVLYGSNGQRAMKWDGTNWYNWGIAAATTAPVVTPVAGLLSPTFGYIYSYAWANDGSTGSPANVGTSSAFSASTGPQVSQNFNIQAPAPPADIQLNTIYWFRSVDGGGQPYFIARVNINTGAVTNADGSPYTGATFTPIAVGGKFIEATDSTADSKLNQLVIAPLVNNPPLQGKYVAYGQGRIAIINLTGAPQDVIYSGFETILIGNPPECFPPNNRFRLSVGAETAAGGGIIQAGLVVFSQSGHMYMLRGQFEDITTTQPVVFTQYLEELPWTLGCFSHFTIRSTPHGLVWLAGDKTVQVFDGYNPPQDISYPVYPLLRSITPGTEQSAVAAYFNWLDRDWYCLSIATNGSLTNNTLIFWGFNEQISTIDVFVASVNADFISVVESPTLQRQLVVSSMGRLSIVPITEDTVGGITQDLTIQPATAAILPAFWRSGYFGNDTPQRQKMWRWGHIATDQDPSTFKVTPYFVNDSNFKQPEYVGVIKMRSSRFALNRRRKRCAIEIGFPDADVPANVVELQVASIPSSDR